MQQFFANVLRWRSVDAGEGRPVFAAPPTELAVHPSETEPGHELYLICDDIQATTARLAERGVQTEPIADRGWGLVTTILLPGGERLGLYEPRHPSPLRSSAGSGASN
ncbi:MAG TPA: hypothetical protein VGI19_02870 [Candidatus Cybelea sp.]